VDTDASSGGPGREPSLAELADAAARAERRVALYRRRVYLGRGEATRLAELERVAAGAAARLRRAQAADADAPHG
jgi:hypothetical protein